MNNYGQKIPATSQRDAAYKTVSYSDAFRDSIFDYYRVPDRLLLMSIIPDGIHELIAYK